MSARLVDLITARNLSKGAVVLRQCQALAGGCTISGPEHAKPHSPVTHELSILELDVRIYALYVNEAGGQDILTLDPREPLRVFYHDTPVVTE